MPLTSAQLQILKTDIANSGDLNSQPNNDDGNFEISRLYGLDSSPNFYVYKNNIPVQEIYNQITWANLTPTDAPDGTTTWLNRAMMCQSKQFNLQIILQGQSFIDATKNNLRAGLQDCLTNVPAGISGANVSAGWVPVRDSLYQVANRGEKLFASGIGTSGNPATRTVYGKISVSDVGSARNLP